jgi:outer membrane receptor for ferrienterochelin and colicins
MEDGSPSAHLAKIDAYSWGDVSVQKKLPKGLDIAGGSRNIFNVTNIGTSSDLGATAHSGGGIRPIGSGRSYFLSLTYTLNQ